MLGFDPFGEVPTYALHAHMPLHPQRASGLRPLRALQMEAGRVPDDDVPLAVAVQHLRPRRVG